MVVKASTAVRVTGGNLTIKLPTTWNDVKNAEDQLLKRRQAAN